MTGNETISETTPSETTPATAWTGWVSFGGMILIIVGGFNVIEGLVTLLDEDYYLVGSNGLAVDVSYAVLGWLQLALGFLSIAVGVGLLRGNMVARVVGVFLAAVSSIVHLAAMAAHPFWSTIVIVFNIMVIYSIVAHGREMKKLW